jgi:hypothetical protein
MEPTIKLSISKYSEIFNRLKELEDTTKDNAERIKELENTVYMLERTVYNSHEEQN